MACQTDCSGQSLTSPHHLMFLQLQLGLLNDIWLLAKTLFVNKKSNCHVVSFILAQSGRPTLKWSDCMQESRHDPRRAEGSLPSHSCWGAGISLGGSCVMQEAATTTYTVASTCVLSLRLLYSYWDVDEEGEEEEEGGGRDEGKKRKWSPFPLLWILQLFTCT